MGDSDSGYRFGSGIGEDEVARLEAQGAALAPATRIILAEAGIGEGHQIQHPLSNTAPPPGSATVAGIRTIFHPNGP